MMNFEILNSKIKQKYSKDNANYIVRKCYESAGFIEKERLYRYYKQATKNAPKY